MNIGHKGEWKKVVKVMYSQSYKTLQELFKLCVLYEKKEAYQPT